MKSRAWVCAALVAALSGHWAAADESAFDPAGTELNLDTVEAAQMLPFAKLVNEVSPLRRRSVLAPNPLTLFDGALLGYVHGSAGNLSLRRRDLVGVALAPLVLDRLYDSRAQVGADGDFGAGGWRLSLASRIRLQADRAVFIDESGAQRLLRRVGRRLVPVRPEPGALAQANLHDGRIRLVWHDRSEHLFERRHAGAEFLLVRAIDGFGNERRFAYDDAGRLRRVESGGRFFEFLRNGRGNIREVQDDAGRRLSYDYDRHGRLVAAIDVGGHPWHYHYDEHGRLSDVTAPGGNHDLNVVYNADGKVATVVRQGIERRYEYSVDAGQPAGIRVTRVTEHGQQQLFGHNDDGVTVWVQNAAGQRSRLWLTPHNQPRRLVIDGEDAVRLQYDDQARLTRMQQQSGRRHRELVVHYAADGRPAEVVDGSGAVLAAIRRRADGDVQVDGPDIDRRLAVAQDGAATGLALGTDIELQFDVNAAGQIVSARDGDARSLALEYTVAGALASVTFPGGERHAYRHDALGLRTATRVSTGASVDYFYAPEGRIYRYEMTSSEGERAVTSHAFDGRQRLVSIRQDNDQIRLRYGNDGQLAAIAPPHSELRFDYDVLGRLTDVALADEQWRYEYRAGELDLVRQAEQRRFPAAFDPRYAAGELAGVYAALYLRRFPASHGALWLDARAGEFRLTHDLGVPLPGDDLRLALRAISLLDGRFQPGVFGDSADTRSAFNAPSSFLFVPPEYWALNCIVCPGHYPRPAPVPRAAAPGWPSLATVVSMLKPNCYVFPLPNPEPQCRVAISGLPPYLCMNDTADIGATLTPSSLHPNNLSWATNDFLLVQPVGATGTQITLRGVPGTTTVSSGVGTVRGVYSGGVACTSPTKSLNVIAQKALSYSQVVNPALCPERQQDTTALHAVDGCSIPPLISDLLFSGDIQDPVGGTYHAPDRATTFGINQGVIPFGAPVAPLPCNRHDMCYQTCGHNRRGCDDAFDDDMAAVCETAYPVTCPYGIGTPACVAFELEKVNCQIVRTAVYQGVRAAGTPSYRQRQVQHCRCCP